SYPLAWLLWAPLSARRTPVWRPPRTPSRLLHARALTSNGAASRTVKGTPPSASSSCSGCLRVGTAGRFAGDRSPAVSVASPSAASFGIGSRRHGRHVGAAVARHRDLR